MRPVYALLVPILVAMASSVVVAQDVTVPLPEGYTAPDAAPAPQQLDNPAAILEGDGTTVTVPIPGGGEVVVDGPASETPSGVGPIETWSTKRNNPSSVGTGPIGPVPPPE